MSPQPWILKRDGRVLRRADQAPIGRVDKLGSSAFRATNTDGARITTAPRSRGASRSWSLASGYHGEEMCWLSSTQAARAVYFSDLKRGSE